MGSPIGSVGSTRFVNAVIGGREYSGSARDGFIGNVCYCEATGKVVNLSQDNNLPQDKRGWYRVRADKAKGQDNSGISYTYGGTYDLSNRESVQYARIDIDNTSDPAYSGGGRVDFTVYWAAIGPLDPSCVPPNPGRPGTDYPWFDSDEWYTVEVAADPANGGTVYGGGVFTKNASCTITALPNSGWRFSGWTSSSGGSSNDATHTFAVVGDVTWTAHFTRIPYVVTVEASPVAGGAVSGGGTFYFGEYCTITATPAADWFFVRWESSTGDTSTDASHRFQVTGNITWTAIFQQGIGVKVRIVRGASLGSFNAPTWIDPSKVTVIENTNACYIANVRPDARFNLGNYPFDVTVNDASRYEFYLARVIKGDRPGTYALEGYPNPSSFHMVVSLNAIGGPTVPSGGIEVEIFMRYKSTGELLYGSSGALLHGEGGSPIYL